MTTQGSSIAKRVPSGPRADRKRQAIIQAARETFLTEGFDASMDRVAAVAGVSKVTVYNHFDSKEILFIAVITRELDRALEEAERLVESRLVTSVDVKADLIQACRAWAAGVCAPETIALRNLVAGEMRRFPELGETWQERGPQRFHRVIAAALDQLNEMRLLSIPDVDLAVLQLSGLVVSPSQVYGAYGSPPDPELTDRLIVSGVDMFLQFYRYGDRELSEAEEGSPYIGEPASRAPSETAAVDG
ncbi:TetR/AcrR family transcriptional regulator [Streptomyces sp. NPDC006668]|uniref:TetR/AcrR family transcriptional regulator n=1 Tax=Streptomyces sp. NPDC006668 TaxID=3156903 RepID=UPI0033FC5078